MKSNDYSLLPYFLSTFIKSIPMFLFWQGLIIEKEFSSKSKSNKMSSDVQIFTFEVLL